MKSSSRGELEWTKASQKSPFSGALRPQNDPMTVVFRYIVDSVNANMRVNLWLMCMFCSVVSE